MRVVELADGGRPLNGQGRVDCEQAHATHPAGFLAVVADAADGTTARSHRAVLISYVRKGYHVRAEELARLGVDTPPPPLAAAARRYGRGLTAREVIERTRESK